MVLNDNLAWFYCKENQNVVLNENQPSPIHDDEVNLPVEVVHLHPVHAVEPDEERLGVHLHVLVVVRQDSPEKLGLGGLVTKGSKIAGAGRGGAGD